MSNSEAKGKDPGAYLLFNIRKEDHCPPATAAFMEKGSKQQWMTLTEVPVGKVTGNLTLLLAYDSNPLA
jgi:hypothetical protein